MISLKDTNMANIDTGYMKYPGWNTTANTPEFQFLYSPERLLVVQQKISQLLQGLRDDGRPIIVPLETIGSVIYQCYESQKHQVGDIYTVYQIPQTAPYRDDVRDIIDRAINIIVSQIRNEEETAQNNRKLTVWNTLYGEFNKQGLRAHAPIKVRRRGPMRFQFHMQY